MTKPENLSHDRAIELLPWLVNGSLEGDEREAVSAHATSCVICRREMEHLDAVGASIAKSASAQTPAPDMRAINLRIDDMLDNDTGGRALLGRLRGWFADPWRGAFAVQTAVLLAVLAVWVVPHEAQPPYTTLTTESALPAGDYLRVVFAPSLDADAVNAMIRERGLALLDGPSRRGVYTLRFADGAADRDRDTALASLRADRNVLFAEPVDAGADP